MISVAAELLEDVAGGVADRDDQRHLAGQCVGRAAEPRAMHPERDPTMLTIRLRRKGGGKRLVASKEKATEG